MEFKFRGDVVLFEVLAIVKDSKLIVKQELTSATATDFVYKVKYLGDGVKDINVGDELILKSVECSPAFVPGEILSFTNVHNILGFVKGRNCETHTAEETLNMLREAWKAQKISSHPAMDMQEPSPSSGLVSGKNFYL